MCRLRDIFSAGSLSRSCLFWNSNFCCDTIWYLCWDSQAEGKPSSSQTPRGAGKWRHIEHGRRSIQLGDEYGKHSCLRINCQEDNWVRRQAYTPIYLASICSDHLHPGHHNSTRLERVCRCILRRDALMLGMTILYCLRLPFVCQMYEYHSALKTVTPAGIYQALNWADAWPAIKGVWASKWNSRAISSLSRIGLRHRDLQMSILCQGVVPAAYAFVSHTRHPITGISKWHPNFRTGPGVPGIYTSHASHVHFDILGSTLTTTI